MLEDLNFVGLFGCVEVGEVWELILVLLNDVEGEVMCYYLI